MLSGFGNHFATEAVAGALPVGRNSPQRPAFGLYAEQLSGTAFTVPRDHNRRSWLYRLRPGAAHPPFARASEEVAIAAPTPNRLRWDPPVYPGSPVDFADALTPVVACGDAMTLTGAVVQTYAASASMGARAIVNADAETLIVPQEGRLEIVTELGRFDVEPCQIALIPRGLRYKVGLREGHARGYVAENRGSPFRLPDLGPIGSNGLASPRDFETPGAAFEDLDTPHDLVMVFMGQRWTTKLDHSPFDVVAWHGNLAPSRYDLRRFNTIGSISFDHPDPSIFTVLTSPSDTPGRANADFVVFPPRWQIAEDTFRPPWFHRNVMSECMGLITGAYDAKAEGFAPGGLSLHNLMAGHGPDVASWRTASDATLAPHRLDETMAFMVESCWPFRVSVDALARAQPEYDAAWADFPKAQLP